MKTKGIIFDLDGTLLDTLIDIADSVNQALSEHGYAVNPIADYRFYIGEGEKNLVRKAMHKKTLTPEVFQVLKSFKEIYDTGCNIKSSVYDGIGELLDWLEEKDVKCAILSNKNQDFVDKMVSYYFPDRQFSVVVGQQAGKPIKPDPAPVFEIIEMLECRKNEVLLVGDSRFDTETAKNAGIFALGVSWGFSDRKELFENGADAVADTPEELREIIDRYFSMI